MTHATATNCSRVSLDFRFRLSAVRKSANPAHIYEVRPRKDKRGVYLISDALPFGRLWYGEPRAEPIRDNNHRANKAGFIRVSSFQLVVIARRP